jgi:hypothetical protein
MTHTIDRRGAVRQRGVHGDGNKWHVYNTPMSPSMYIEHNYLYQYYRIQDELLRILWYASCIDGDKL